MPLSKEKNRERMRAIRATQVQPNRAVPEIGRVDIEMEPEPIYPKLEAQGITMKGNKIISVQPTVQPKLHNNDSANQIPRYNARIHKKGDTVRMPSGEIVVVPELDELGNPVPEI